jgi:hypothetical protein
LTVQSDRLQLAPLPAAAGNFVEHPAGLPRYSIVAAGIVRASTTVAGGRPVYNRLVVTSVAANGDVGLTFGTPGGPGEGDYRQPDGTFQYIVKALVVLPDEGIAPIVTLRQPFGRSDFILNVTNGGRPFGITALRQMFLSIEVSRFGAARIIG